MLPNSLPEDRPHHQSRLRVRYAETDTMQVAHHSSFVIWIEVARIEFLRAHGIHYRSMEEEGTILPVAEVQMRLLAPARYDDEIGIDCFVQVVRSRQLRLGYRILKLEDGHLRTPEEILLAWASTLLVPAGRDLKTQRFGEDIFGRLRALAGN